jgi:hypothetical protein
VDAVEAEGVHVIRERLEQPMPEMNTVFDAVDAELGEDLLRPA